MPENCTECPEDAPMDGWMMLMLMSQLLFMHKCVFI